MLAILVNICRAILGLTFIFSGYVKATDPLGSQYKIHDYLEALGLASFIPDWLTLIMAIGLAAVEFSMGIFTLFAMRRHATSKLMLAFMAMMTAITVWIAIANPVSDCGCFGDAIILTNVETLIKNIVLLACSVMIFIYPQKMVRFISRPAQWIAVNYTVLFSIVSSILSLYLLPPFDFRPYYIGADIAKGMEIPKGAEQPEFETTFVLEKDGKKQTFTIDNYPDSTWTFVDSKTVQTKQGYVPPIHDFNMEDAEGNDITADILEHKGYTFLLISPHLENADDSNFGEIDQIYEYAKENDIPFYCLTASTDKGRQHWQDITGAEYPFLTTDETTLKTIVRSNPGLLMLKGSKIVGKWSHNNLPDIGQPGVTLANLEKQNANQKSAPRKVFIVILWFILPLSILTLADRTWAWTKWLKKKENSTIIFNLFKRKKKMRKKIVAGNWKMNMNLQDGVALAKEINEALVADKPNCDVIICTPFIHLASVAQVLDSKVVGLGAENCADKAKGAYTGEVSAEMVKSTGAQYVILGHSERRQYYGETAEILKEKVELALANGLKVIFCCGETLEERKTATSDQAEEMLAYIRSIVAEKYGKEAAEETSILYGGSCKASNAPELFAKPNIDGGLIGGASLKAADFKGIIDAWKK